MVTFMVDAIWISGNSRNGASQSPSVSTMSAAFLACVEAAHPARWIRENLDHLSLGRRILVVGAGKAAASMAQALEEAYDGEVSGVVVTRYGHRVPTRRIEVLEASHPVPDAAGIAATQRIVDALANCEADSHVVGLFSGGGSALLCRPAEGLSLEDKQNVNAALLASGLPIGDMNRIRTRLSTVKGGKLLRFAPSCSFTSLLVSDVPGDDPAVIASGPTVEPSARDDDRDLAQIAARAGLEAWPHVMKVLLDPSESRSSEHPVRPRRIRNMLITSPALALTAAREIFHASGYDVQYLGDDLEGDATNLGAEHAALVLRMLPHVQRPTCILSGGETTVKVSNANGEGGRNTEYLLSLALNLDGCSQVHALAADTDGIDGRGTHAGAFLTPTTLARARASGLDPAELLKSNLSLAVFIAAGGVLTTGPTLTNVNDFRAIVVEP